MGMVHCRTERLPKAEELLTSSTVLIHFDPSLDIILMCDASPFGIGAVLAHWMKDGSDRPIDYASRTAEKRYCHLEKEGLAIIFGVKRFNQFLLGRPSCLTTNPSNTCSPNHVKYLEWLHRECSVGHSHCLLMIIQYSIDYDQRCQRLMH